MNPWRNHVLELGEYQSDFVDIGSFIDQLAKANKVVEVLESHLNDIRKRNEVIDTLVFTLDKIVDVRFIVLLPPVVLFDHVRIPSLHDVLDLELVMAVFFSTIDIYVAILHVKITRDNSILIFFAPHTFGEGRVLDVVGRRLWFLCDLRSCD